MKINKVIIFALVAFVIASVASVSINIKSATEQESIRKNMLNGAYSELTAISRSLDVLINTEAEINDYEASRQCLSALSIRFAKVDTIFTWYASIFSPSGSRNVYPGGLFNFGFISDTLMDCTGEANGNRYTGITMDNALSENEILYLTILQNDIDIVIEAMVAAPQENGNLTTEQIDKILNTFFDKWSFHNESSPYLLLVSE